MYLFLAEEARKRIPLLSGLGHFRFRRGFVVFCKVIFLKEVAFENNLISFKLLINTFENIANVTNIPHIHPNTGRY